MLHPVILLKMLWGQNTYSCFVNVNQRFYFEWGFTHLTMDDAACIKDFATRHLP